MSLGGGQVIGGPSDLHGINDPDDWYGWWLELHPSQLFAGEFARFALRRLTDPQTPDGPGSGEIRFSENQQEHEVLISYLLERFPESRLLHVLSIKSPDDPLPPWIQRPP